MSFDLKVPEAGESVEEVQVVEWMKKEGETVEKDETVVVIETDKASMDVSTPVSGRLVEILKHAGESVSVGEVIGRVEELDEAEAREEPKKREEQQSEAESKGEAEEEPAEAGPDRSADRNDEAAELEVSARGEARDEDGRGEERIPMSPVRKRIAARLVEGQHRAALLTTFQDVDMSEVQDLRKQHGKRFQEEHGVGLGLMPFFVRAVVEALEKYPRINGFIDGEEMVLPSYRDIGIAIGTGEHLVVPVLRDAQQMSLAEIQEAIESFARRAEADELEPRDMRGGTFTITNGGIFGSLFSTPIVNPPQSAILGMHAIEERPVVRDGEIVARPMMYIALTYDHRIVDGREAVSFLREVKETLQDPTRMMLEC